MDALGSAGGLLEPVEWGADRLRFAKDFLKSHSVDEVKRILAARVSKAIEASEKDWERLTKVANKFGIARVAGYFAKLWRACSQESKEDLWRYAVPFLLDLPDPGYALDEIEAMKTDSSKCPV